MAVVVEAGSVLAYAVMRLRYDLGLADKACVQTLGSSRDLCAAEGGAMARSVVGPLVCTRGSLGF